MNLNAKTVKLRVCLRAMFRNESSFLGGIASIMDISSVQSKYHHNKSGAEADCESLRDDWRAIGADMTDAISDYAKSGK